MKPIPYLVLVFLAATASGAAPLQDNIKIDALIVTKAELRRHLVAPEDDHFKPATYRDLEASSGAAQPDYLVVRFQTKVPGHYAGEAEARIDGNKHGFKLNVLLHFNRGWVEYFIPLDGLGWWGMERTGTSMRLKEGGPTVKVDWNSLHSE